MKSSTINKEEIEKFSKMASQWWDPNGKFKPLHKFNPIRIGYIKNHLEDVSQKSKVEIVYNYSKWDKTFWPYTSKGFFKLKQQIPLLLKKLEIIQK